MVDYRKLAMKLAAVVASNGICPECGFKFEHRHSGQCSKAYDAYEPRSRNIEPPFVAAFESAKQQGGAS